MFAKCIYYQNKYNQVVFDGGNVVHLLLALMLLLVVTLNNSVIENYAYCLFLRVEC